MNTSGQINAHAHVRMMSPELLLLLQDVLIVYILSPVCLLGCIANAINIIIFSKMNQKQTINISLLALAISDFLGLFGTFWSTVCFYPVVRESRDLPFIPGELHLVTGAWVHSVFATVTANLTFLISAERCLCILVPMKIKTLITTTRIKVLIALTFLWGIGSQCILFYTTRVVWKFSHFSNTTVLGITQIENWVEIKQPVQSATNILSDYVIFLGVVAWTSVLVVKLRQQTKWRRQTTNQISSAASSNSAKREARAAKSVCVISGVFIACYLPDSVSFTSALLVPDYNFGRRFHDLVLLSGAATFLLESVNASLNLGVYLKYNRDFRKHFRQLFGLPEKQKQKTVTYRP